MVLLRPPHLCSNFPDITLSCHGILDNLLATRSLAIYIVFHQSLPNWPILLHNRCAGDPSLHHPHSKPAAHALCATPGCLNGDLQCPGKTTLLVPPSYQPLSIFCAEIQAQ